MIKLIAFDWNGTLLDDTRIVAEATNITRRSFGYPPISFKRFRETYIIPVVDFWLATGGKKEDMATEHNIYHPAYEKLLANRNIKLKKGAKELLLWLQKNSIKTIIYSNHTEREIIYQLKRFKIRQYIGKVLARKGIEDQAHLHKRGKEAKLLDYIKSHKFKRTEIISIGDTCEEIDTGHNLKLHTVAISGGENTTKRIKESRPDFLIGNLSQLIKIVEKLN